MFVRHLTVADFRSWVSADVALDPGPTVFLGANGQGKTNLVEAVAFLATFASHRVAADAPLVRTGAAAAVVRGAVVSEGRELRLDVQINPGRANRVQLGGSVVRPREALGVLRAVLFAPEDLAIVRGDPAERRRFLDELATQRAPRLAGVRADYERVLRQRAALLKSAGSRRGELSTLDVWDGHLARHGAELLAARLALVADLAPLAAAAYAEVAPSSAALGLDYASAVLPVVPVVPVVPVLPAAPAAPAVLAVPGSGGPTPGELEAMLLEELTRRRAQELERGVNLVGPHRDDLMLRLGELPVRGYASHGESWSAALALRLGSFELLRALGSDPVLILDDVFAELDTGRREQLARTAGKAEQVLVTAAVAADVPAELSGVRYFVEDGTVSRG